MNKTVICHDIEGKEHRVSTNDLRWRPSAYGIVIKDDSILLSPQFNENSYDLPGGGIDLGESPEDAVIREVKEETGLDVVNPKAVNISFSFFKLPRASKNEFVQSIMLYYACDFTGGKLSSDGFDEYEQQYARLAEWVPLPKLDSIDVASSVDWRPFVKQAVTKYANLGH